MVIVIMTRLMMMTIEFNDPFAASYKMNRKITVCLFKV